MTSHERSRSRCLPARLPRHLRHAGDGRGRRGDEDPGRPGRCPSPRARSAPRSRTTSSAPIRPTGCSSDEARRPQRRGQVPPHHLGRSARRDRGAPEERSRRTNPRDHPALQLRRHDGHGAVQRRWTGASSTSSAPRCSTARSAPPPASSGMQGDRSAARSAWTRSASTRPSSSSSGARTRSSPTCTCGRACRTAKRRGAKVVAIDPYRSLSAEKCTQHIALLPGTDGALALGMMHVLIATA